MHSSKGTKLKLYTPHGAIEYPLSILWRCQPVSSVVGTVFFNKKNLAPLAPVPCFLLLILINARIVLGLSEKKLWQGGTESDTVDVQGRCAMFF